MSQDAFNIRRMEKSDLKEVESIQQTIIQGPVPPDWTSALAALIGWELSRCLVAEDENKRVIGFIISELSNGAFGASRAGWLGWIGVSPKKMGQGVGGAMAKALFEIFKQEGVENIYSAVRWDSVDMLSFFKSLGFDRSNFINLRKKLV